MSECSRNRRLYDFCKTLLCAVFLSVLFAGCNEVAVVQEITQSQSHAVIATLADNGVEATAERAKGSKPIYSVMLSPNDYARAIQILRDANLPGEVRPSVAQLLAPEGLLPAGREIEMLRLDRAVAGEIEELLASHPAVVSARAVVRSASLPQGFGLPQAFGQQDSTQIIKLAPSVSLIVTVREAIAEEQIKNLVRQIAVGVLPENISIVLESARVNSVLTQSSTGTAGTAGKNIQPRLSSFLFFWKVPQSDALGLTLAVFSLVILMAVIAAVVGFASGTARASATFGYGSGDLSRTALPGSSNLSSAARASTSDSAVTGSRLRLTEQRREQRTEEKTAQRNNPADTSSDTGSDTSSDTGSDTSSGSGEERRR